MAKPAMTMPSTPGNCADQWRIMFLLLSLAIVARFIAFDPFAMHHPDEVLQYLEPANRLLTGDGIVTWEYRYGMRGMLLPLLLAGPMALGQLLDGTMGGIVAARLCVALVALGPVLAAWMIGRRFSPLHAIVATGVMAIWPEQVDFSVHLLTETIATSLFLVGAALLVDRPRGRRLACGGALLAAAVLMRFHYSVAAIVFAVFTFGRDWRSWGVLALGALPVVLFSCAVDLAFGQWPFEWLWTNVSLNLVEGRAQRFGVEPAGHYLTEIWHRLGWVAPIMLFVMVKSHRSLHPLALAALANLVAHSAIGHKEYRFIQMTMAALPLLAALASVDVVQGAARRWSLTLRDEGQVALLCLCWLAAAIVVQQWANARPTSSAGPAGLALSRLAGSDPAICGIGVVARDYSRVSKAYVGRPVPIILLDGSAPPRADLFPPGHEIARVNAVIASDLMAPLLPGFATRSCLGKGNGTRCLYVRSGGCVETPEAAPREIQRALKSVDL